MADGSEEENIQFSLEATGLDEDKEMTDELFCKEDVEWPEDISQESQFKFQVTKKWKIPECANHSCPNAALPQFFLSFGL